MDRTAALTHVTTIEYDDPRIEQHIADPRPLHHVRLHCAPSLSDAAGDFLHRLADFRMVGLAGIARPAHCVMTLTLRLFGRENVLIRAEEVFTRSAKAE
jgi:hypothetical protein